ncbi:MAG: ATP-binding protein [candidate division Zixibacteria bacterium]
MAKMSKDLTPKSQYETTSKISIASELKKFSAPKTDFRIGDSDEIALGRDDLRALYEVAKAVNSSLILDEILIIVMKKSIELLKAERGFLMLLDSDGELQFKTAHNINKSELKKSDLQISSSIAAGVVQDGKSIYTADAMTDKRFAHKQSVLEMNIRSAMCVPLRIKDQIIGVVYLDNSAGANIFLKSDLYLFELFADQAALAIHNAQLYSDVFDLQRLQEAILDKTPVGIMVLAENGRMVSYNNVAYTLLQKADLLPIEDSEELVNNNFLERLSESEIEFFRDNIAKSAFQPVEILSRRLKTRTEDIVFRYKFSPFLHVDEGFNGRIIVIEDITEKVLLEQFLILSEKMAAKGEMAAAIGHELNNYLTSISVNAQLLSKVIEKGQTEKIPVKVNAILDGIDKMKRFTTGLMDYSALEVTKSYHNIVSVIDEVVFFVKPLEKFKKITVEANIQQSIPEVSIDVGQINQVILNLLMNAAEAIGDSGIKRGQININVRLDGCCLLILISDNGPGISEEIFSNLFMPHITSKKSGHGLGLSTSLRIMKNHGGDISVSNNQSGGATFTVSLPLE